MNKSQERQLYQKVAGELDEILQLLGQRPNRKRLMRRLSNILDIVSSSALSSKHKAKLIQMIDAINGKMQQCCTPVKEPPQSSVKKTKRYSSSKRLNQDKGISASKQKQLSDLLDKPQDHSRTIPDQFTPVKNEYQMRSLQIKNQILQEQVDMLKQRVLKARSSHADEAEEETAAALQTELHQTKSKERSLALRVHDLTKELTDKESKIEQLTYQNDKLNKLLRIRQQEIKEGRSRYQQSMRDMEAKLEGMKRYQLQARAFEAVKKSLAEGSGDEQLKQIIRKYKTLIR